MFGTTKWTLISHCQLNLQILVRRKIFVFNLAMQASILYKLPCSQYSVQQKWTLLAIHSYWCEEAIVIMLVESHFSLNGFTLKNDDSTIHNQQKPRMLHIYRSVDKLSAVLRSCNIFGRRYRENCSKELPAKIHLTVDKFKSFPLQFLSDFRLQIHRSTTSLRFVLHLSGLSDFCISMQLFLVAIKVPILYPTCKISVFSVATSFSVNYFCYENLSIIIIEEIMISSTNQVFINYLSTIVFDFLPPKLPLAACNNCLTSGRFYTPFAVFQKSIACEHVSYSAVEKSHSWAFVSFS